MAEPRPARGPGAIGDPAELANELEKLARQIRTPPPGGYAGALAGLARIMRSLDSAEAEPWTQVDVLALLGNPGVVASASRARRAIGRILSAASSVLILALVLCVPLEIMFASRAYGSMIRDPIQRTDAISQGFPRLWEDGFGGHLPKLLDLTHMAGYALAAVVALIVLTLIRTGLAQADERAETKLMARLVPALTRAQLALNQRRLDSPGRFAGELSLAARELNSAIAQASRVQEDTQAVVSSAGTLARTGTSAASQLRSSTAELADCAQRLDATSGRIEGAVHTLGGEVARLGKEISSRIAVATDGLTAAGTEFATRIEQSGSQAAHHIGGTYREAVAASAAHLMETMTLFSAQLTTSVGNVRTAAASFESSAERMTEAVSRLSEVMARAPAGPGTYSPDSSNGSPDSSNGRVGGHGGDVRSAEHSGAEGA